VLKIRSLEVAHEALRALSDVPLDVARAIAVIDDVSRQKMDGPC
jgi:hypothetical protein